MKFRRLLRMSAMWTFHVGVIRPLLRVYWGVRFRRRALVPKGPCLVVANHNSHLDAALLMSLFPIRRLPHVHPVAAADYFGKSPFRQTMAMVLMNGIPIERSAPAGKDPLAPMVEALNAGESLIFFPEGSRGEAGVVAQFRPGVGRLTRSVPGLLVVPVFLSGPERIWPRGEVLPLPLGIDVNVGKPRTYPPHEDARVVADQVREDVLALAPPPPPVPGPRPSPPIRAVVCGIDPEACRGLFLKLTAKLGSMGRTIGITEPILESDESGVREAVGGIPLARSSAWPRALAWLFRTGGLFRGNKFAQMVEQARIDEALEHGHAARFVVGHGSALVDLLAWAEADFYSGQFDEKGLQQLMLYLSGQRRIPYRSWWRFVRKAPEVWLLNVFDLARPPVADVLILVRATPEAALEGFRSRGQELGAHHTAAFLGTLQQAYGLVAEALRRRGRVEVLEFDAAGLDADAAADAAEAACRKRALESAPSVAEA